MKNYSLVDIPIQYPQPIVTIILRGGKTPERPFFSPTYLWDGKSSNRVINKKHIKYYKSKSIYNKVEYSIATGLYCTTQCVKVHFIMPCFSIYKIITYHFHIDNEEDGTGIGYEMIIGHDIMVQLVMMTGFRFKVLSCVYYVVPTK